MDIEKLKMYFCYTFVKDELTLKIIVHASEECFDINILVFKKAIWVSKKTFKTLHGYFFISVITIKTTPRILLPQSCLWKRRRGSFWPLGGGGSPKRGAKMGRVGTWGRPSCAPPANWRGTWRTPSPPSGRLSCLCGGEKETEINQSCCTELELSKNFYIKKNYETSKGQ